MRNNQPVSGREYCLRADQSLISRTDLKGTIVYANREFIAVSGFSEDELIGSPHNIVRHPDMPQEAFADMWETLRSGHAWTGMVKNRRKNGDHYWVQANATPIWDKGVVIGYTSVRTMPRREEIDSAEILYERLRTGTATGLAIRQGRVVRTGLAGILAGMVNLRIKSKISLALGILCGIALMLGVFCLNGLEQTHASLDSIYRTRTVPIGQLDTIARLLNHDEVILLNAISSGDPKEAQAAQQLVKKDATIIQKTWDAYRAAYLKPEEKKLSDHFAQSYHHYANAGLAPAVAALASGAADEAKRLHREVMKPAFAPVSKDLDDLLNLQLSVAKQEAEAATQNYALIRNTVGGILLLAVVFATLMRFYLSRNIVQPLQQAVDVAKQIAACNLITDIRIRSRDETGELLHALNVMKLSLANIVQGVRGNAKSIAASAAEIAAGNMDLSARTEQQAASLEETASSMEELTATVQHNAERSNSVKSLVDGAKSTAIEGGAAMDQVVSTMAAITDSSRRITDIIGVIDGIAFQTNILALNAAVEAARAGEQGRGFAVVAAEVRGLAQRSAAAAKEIKSLITDSVSHIEIGSSEVVHARQTIESIVESVMKVADLIGEISMASREQSEGIGQVGTAVAQIDQVTQQNAALVEEAAAASASLQQKGVDLLQEVGVFRLEEEETTQSVGDTTGRMPLALRGGRKSLAIH